MSLPLLELPSEIRRMIYRYLLSTKYTKTEKIHESIVRNDDTPPA